MLLHGRYFVNRTKSSHTSGVTLGKVPRAPLTATRPTLGGANWLQHSRLDTYPSWESVLHSLVMLQTMSGNGKPCFSKILTQFLQGDE